MSDNDVLVVLCNCPDTETARKLAASAVEQRLAACVNIIPGVESVYHWQGKIENDTESTLLIKTSGNTFDALREHLQAHHPDELPEIIAVPVVRGLPGYLDWVRESTS